MGLYSAALLAATRKSYHRSHGFIEITVQSTTLKYSDGDYSSESGGHYNGIVTSWGEITRQSSDVRGGLVTPSTRVTISDVTREFDALVMGQNGRHIRGSAVAIKVGHRDVASSSWCTWFTGVIVDFQKTGLAYELSLELDTSWLNAPINDELITAVDWPNAHQSAIGQREPKRYGKMDATNAGGKGSVVCPYVDTSGFRYLLSRGACKTGSPDRVYEDGVLTVATYAKSYVLVNGKVCTVIDFTTNRAEAVITADANGLETVGDGSGTLITNPADVIRHYVTNFVLGSSNQRYQAGPYFSTSTRFDATTWGALSTACAALGLVAGADFSLESGTLRDLMAKWLSAWRWRGWFTSLGLLAAGLWDHNQGSVTAADVYPATRLTEDDDVGQSFKVSFGNGSGVISGATADWQTVQGKPGQQWDARDLSVSVSERLPIDLRWTIESGTSAEADGRSARYVTSQALLEHRDQVMVATQVCQLWRGDIDMLTDLLWSHSLAPSNGTGGGTGWGIDKSQARQMRVIGVSLNLQTKTVRIMAQDTRMYIHSLWQVDRFTRPASSWEEGNARMDRGTATVRVTSRASIAWVQDPESGLVTERGVDAALKAGYFNNSKISRAILAGRVIQQASLNYLKQCAGTLTGWTTAGTVALEATDHPTLPAYWNAAYVANCVKLGTAASSITRTTAAIPNQFIAFWGVFASSGSQPVVWQFQRLSDNLYFRASDSTWQVAATDNSQAIPSGLVVKEQFLARIDLGGTSVAVNITIKNTAGDTLRVYHLQVDTNPWPSSPILTTTAEVTRASESYTISNNVGARVWPNTRGTLIIEGQPFWSLNDDNSIDHTVVAVVYDASNWYKLYYDPTTGLLRFERRAAGATVTATVSVSPVGYGIYGFAARWCSSEGELGMAPYTIDVFSRFGSTWTKGTSAVGAAIPTEVDTINLRIGDQVGAVSSWDGVLRQPFITPVVYTDEEIARRLGIA